MTTEKTLPHQQRVLDEKKALDEKVKALIAFIDTSPVFETLDIAEQMRLREQSEIMWEYSEVLGQRIAAFSA